MIPGLGWAAAVALALQQPETIARVLAADTARPVARARSAQDAFERSRRFQLPVSSSGGGRCDERIGRFCYWYDDGDTTLPAEPEPIRTSRDRLLATLASAQTDRPDSDWLVGQRVRYLIEQAELDSAIAVALRCGATAWWCDALGGMALHAAERFPEADAAFRVALAAMPEPIRCDWTDWTMAFDDQLARRSKAADCAERAALADSAFWLGQPLLTRPGNDLRTEFYSRRVMASLHGAARSPHLIPWGRDMEELMLRYGWSTRFSRSDPGLRTLDQPSVIGHQRSPAYHFFPLVGDGTASAAWRWDPLPARPRSRYAPTYATRFRDVDRFQIARFPRGDSTTIVGILDPAVDTALAGRPTDLRLAAATAPDAIAVATTDSAGPGALVLAVAGDPAIVSVEASTRGGRHFLRGRIGLDPIDRSAPLLVSDPLLFEPGPELPAGLDQAAARALPSTRFSRARPVGVYWETAGGTGDSVSVSVSVLPTRRGLLGRLGEGLSVVKRKAPLTLQWQAGPGAASVTGRAVELDLGRLRPGKYLLRLDARAGGTVATALRTIELIP